MCHKTLYNIGDVDPPCKGQKPERIYTAMYLFFRKSVETLNTIIQEASAYVCIRYRKRRFPADADKHQESPQAS